MKKSCITLFLVYFSFLAISQNTISNPRFEQWSGNNPVGWQTSNNFTQQYGVITVSQDNISPYEGNYSIKMETKSIFGFNVPGLITNGQITVNVNQNPPVTVLGGTPFTARPNFFGGYFKYNSTGNDYCQVSVLLLKYDSINSNFDTVAYALFSNNQMVNNWTNFNVPLNYLTNANPDTIQIVAFSSNPSAAVLGSIFWLDSLYFEGGNVTTPNLFNTDKLKVYYDANFKTINIHIFEGGQINFVEIFDLKGNVLYNRAFNARDNHIVIPASNWQKGIYIVKLNNSVHESRKIVIY